MQRALFPPGKRCTAAPRGSGWAGTGGPSAVRLRVCWRCGWGSRASYGVLGSSGTRPDLMRQKKVMGLNLTAANANM